MKIKKPLEIGWEEWISLPDLNLPAIRAKIDTGAKTSALHAFMVEKIIEDGDVKVRFGIHPIIERPEVEVYCTAHLVDEREVISSNGQAELRYVIRKRAQFGKRKWPIEITLTDRETMAYRMLLGRSAMEDKLTVVPGQSFLLGALSPSVYDHIAPRKHKRQLKICILSKARNSYTTDRLVSAAELKGHKVEVINPTRCYVDITHNSTIHYQGKVLTRFDVVVPRIGPSMATYGVAVLRQFESLGTFCINSSLAISHSRDRFLAHQLLGRAGIAMPTTAFAHNPGDTKDMIKIVGGTPLVIKLLDGPQGKGVVLAETNKAAEAVIRAFRGLKANFIAQEYIRDKASKDIRCIVLGNKVIASIENQSLNVELSSHVYRSGACAVTVSLAEKKLVVKAARILGLKFAAVNLLRTKEGPKIIDVSSSPGLRTLETITGLDIAGLVIEYIELHARPRLPKRIVGYHT